MNLYEKPGSKRSKVSLPSATALGRVRLIRPNHTVTLRDVTSVGVIGRPFRNRRPNAESPCSPELRKRRVASMVSLCDRDLCSTFSEKG